MKKILLIILMLVMLLPMMPVSADDTEENSFDVHYHVKAKVVCILPSGDEVIQMITVGDFATEPQHPDIEGKVFDGWFDEEGHQWDFTNPVEEHMTLITKYHDPSITDLVVITIINEDGEVETIELERGTVIPEPPHQEKDGYRFTGYIDEDGNPIDFSQPIEEDMEIKPSYIETHNVIIHYSDDNEILEVIDDGDTLEEPPHEEKQDYEFIGWFDGDTQWDFSNPVTDDMILEPRYRPVTDDTATITIYNGETEYEIEVKKGDKIPEPAHKEREGYEFIGWFDEETGQKWDFNKPVTDDTKLVVRYKEKEKITIIIDDGDSKTTIVVYKGDKITEPKHKDKEDYDFEGWFTEDGKKWDFSKPVEANMKLTVRYKKKASKPAEVIREFVSTGSGDYALMAMVGLGGSMLCLLYNRKKDDEEDE